MFRTLVCLSLLCVALTAWADDSAVAFWVWNRAEPLTQEEASALQAAGVKRLYWQAGELELNGTALGFRRTAGQVFDARRPDRPDVNPEIIPVVRVSTAIRSPEQFSGEALGTALRAVADAAPGRELQLDFDCPDRLLPVYAERLRVARRIADVHHLTITALAGWVTSAGCRTALAGGGRRLPHALRHANRSGAHPRRPVAVSSEAAARPR